MYASQTIVSDFNACQTLAELAHVEEIRPIFMPRPMSIGSLVHRGWQVAWETDSIIKASQAVSDMQNAEIEKISQYLTPDDIAVARQEAFEATEIFERAYTFFGPDDWELYKDSDGKPFSEYQLRLEADRFNELTKAVGVNPHALLELEGVQGTLDNILRHKRNGTLLLLDLKVPASLAPEGRYEMHYQGPLYAALVEILCGVKVDMHGIYQARARRPEWPSQLKKVPKRDIVAPMSRAKIATDWPTYKRALISAGLAPSAYSDIEAKLKPFDRLDITPWSDHFRLAVLREFIEGTIALDQHLSAKKRATMSLSPYKCDTCRYKMYCRTKLDGNDPMRIGLYMREGDELPAPGEFRAESAILEDDAEETGGWDD